MYRVSFCSKGADDLNLFSSEAGNFPECLGSVMSKRSPPKSSATIRDINVSLNELAKCHNRHGRERWCQSILNVYSALEQKVKDLFLIQNTVNVLVLFSCFEWICRIILKGRNKLCQTNVLVFFP
jgi:hypothetical protein